MAAGEAWPFEENELGSPALRVVMGESVGEESCYGEVYFFGILQEEKHMFKYVGSYFSICFFWAVSVSIFPITLWLI